MRIIINDVEGVPRGMNVVGVVRIENGCCPEKAVVVTSNYYNGTREISGYWNYSAQCACGGWCTTGTRSVSAAINEYAKMTARYKAESESFRSDILSFSL